MELIQYPQYQAKISTTLTVCLKHNHIPAIIEQYETM